MDNKSVKDVEPSTRDRYRDIRAAEKIYKMGQLHGKQGETWLNTAKHYAELNGIPLHYVVHTIDRENRKWDPTLKSYDPKSSATGLGQIVRGTAKELGVDPTNPIDSIKGVANYLGKLKQQTGQGDLETLTQAYILGPTGLQNYKQGKPVKGLKDLESAMGYLLSNDLLDNNQATDESLSRSGLSALGGMQQSLSPIMMDNLISNTNNKLSTIDNPVKRAELEEVITNNQYKQNELKKQRDDIISKDMNKFLKLDSLKGF